MKLIKADIIAIQGECSVWQCVFVVCWKCWRLSCNHCN